VAAERTQKSSRIGSGKRYWDSTGFKPWNLNPVNSENVHFVYTHTHNNCLKLKI